MDGLRAHDVAKIGSSFAPDCRFVDHHNGFTVTYESDGEAVGVLTLNADDDHRRADELLRAHAGEP